jgi:hypothetical protein
MKKYSYREPLLVEVDGLYITVAQMQFFLNSPEGKEQFNSCSKEFSKYYRNCLLYNMIFDMMEEDPECAQMYWDKKTQTIALSFKTGGEVFNAMTEVAKSFQSLEGDSEDYI